MSHRDALKRLVELNEEEGLRVFAQALTTNFASEFTLEDYNLSDAIPCWREATVGTVEEKRVKLADPVRRAAMKEIHEERGGLFGAGYPLNKIKVHWISSDVPNDELTSEDPARQPEWFNRDARLKVMDAQGVEAVWMFPSHAVCIEGPMHEDAVARAWGYVGSQHTGDTTALTPVDRILFGSDWPHAEGLGHPRDFLANVASFSGPDQRKILAENARQLTFG